MGPYRILLADKHELFRNGVRNTLLQVEDIHVCGEADNCQELLQLIDTSSPDLIIMEIDLPEIEGLKVLRKVKDSYPEIKILILTKKKERGLVYLLANHGVDGIILKEEPGGELLRAVKVIRNRGRFFSALLSSELMSLIKTKKLLQPFLTLREREILQGIAEGKQSQEIAEALNISIFTVHRHRHNIKKKLKIKYTTDLIRYCLKYKDNF